MPRVTPPAHHSLAGQPAEEGEQSNAHGRERLAVGSRHAVPTPSHHVQLNRARHPVHDPPQRAEAQWPQILVVFSLDDEDAEAARQLEQVRGTRSSELGGLAGCGEWISTKDERQSRARRQRRVVAAHDLGDHARAKGGAAEHDPSQRVVEGGGRRHLKHRVAVVRAPSVADIPAQRLASADDDTSLLLELDFGQSLMHTSKIKMMTLRAKSVRVAYSKA